LAAWWLGYIYFYQASSIFFWCLFVCLCFYLSQKPWLIGNCTYMVYLPRWWKNPIWLTIWCLLLRIQFATYWNMWMLFGNVMVFCLTFKIYFFNFELAFPSTSFKESFCNYIFYFLMIKNHKMAAIIKMAVLILKVTKYISFPPVSTCKCIWEMSRICLLKCRILWKW
jgi:hypothetical protein